MTHFLLRVVSGVVVIAFAGCGGAPVEEYLSWERLTAEPQAVSFQLAIQCAPITEAQLEQERVRHGPHTNRWVTVYANPIAATALKDPASKEFPEGAVIVKEKRRGPNDAVVEAVAFMTKRSRDQFPQSDGWQFSYRPADASATYDGCIACHRASAPKDFVFGGYGQPRAGK
jgi:hypothetical protein